MFIITHSLQEERRKPFIFFQRALPAVAVGVWRAEKNALFLISNQEDTR